MKIWKKSMNMRFNLRHLKKYMKYHNLKIKLKYFHYMEHYHLNSNKIYLMKNIKIKD